MESLRKQAGRAFLHSTFQLICIAFYPQILTGSCKHAFQTSIFKLLVISCCPQSHVVTVICKSHAAVSSPTSSRATAHRRVSLFRQPVQIGPARPCSQQQSKRHRNADIPLWSYATDTHHEKAPRSTISEPEERKRFEKSSTKPTTLSLNWGATGSIHW